MSIGEDLAAARHQAGLSLTEVSERTRISEAMVRGIEGDDYTACGGDFYARSFIRTIARAVGADTAALMADYDATHMARGAVTTADLLGPVTPVRLRERRGRNWTAVLAVALVILLGVAADRILSASGHAAPATHHKGHLALPSAVATKPPRYAGKIVIRLTALQPCWVDFTSRDGKYLSQAYVVAGATKTWTFRRAVDMRLGNPAGIKLTVDGRNPVPPGTNQPITLTLNLPGASR